MDLKDELPGQDEYLPVSIWKDVVCSGQFETDHVRPVIKGDHINVSALRSWGSVEAQAEQDRPRTELLIGTDSKGSLASTVKGGAQSPTLVGVLQTMLLIPCVAGGGLRWKGFYITSKDISIDDPTREVELR